MNNSTPDSCQNCDYWLRGSDLHGYCQRHAPAPVLARPEEETYEYDERGSPVYVAIWPQTSEYDWCGEYRKAKKQP